MAKIDEKLYRPDGTPVNFAGDYAAYQQSKATEAARAQANLEWNLGANWQDIYDYDSGDYKDGYSVADAGGRLGTLHNTGYDMGSRNNPNSAYSSSYRSPYADQIDALLSQIRSQKNFRYNVEDDPLYHQYKQQYQLQGARAMQDTLGAVAGNTGGMVSSWATTAAQQAADYHGAQLNAMVPQLHNQAYNQYLDAQDAELRRLSALVGADNTEYGRHRDTINDQRAAAELAYQRERDALLDSRYDQQWDYNVGRDVVADQRYAVELERKLSGDEEKDKSGGSAYEKALAAMNSIPTTSGKSDWWYAMDKELQRVLTNEEYWRLMQIGFRDVSTDNPWE